MLVVNYWIRTRLNTTAYARDMFVFFTLYGWHCYMNGSHMTRQTDPKPSVGLRPLVQEVVTWHDRPTRSLQLGYVPLFRKSHDTTDRPEAFSWVMSPCSGSSHMTRQTEPKPSVGLRPLVPEVSYYYYSSTTMTFMSIKEGMGFVPKCVSPTSEDIKLQKKKRGGGRGDEWQEKWECKNVMMVKLIVMVMMVVMLMVAGWWWWWKWW